MSIKENILTHLKYNDVDLLYMSISVSNEQWPLMKSLLCNVVY